MHAEPLQCVINMAAEWILGLNKQNTATDAFTLCYKLGFSPIFQELCVMRARLAYKLTHIEEGEMKLWLKYL